MNLKPRKNDAHSIVVDIRIQSPSNRRVALNRNDRAWSAYAGGGHALARCAGAGRRDCRQPRNGQLLGLPILSAMLRRAIRPGAQQIVVTRDFRQAYVSSGSRLCKNSASRNGDRTNVFPKLSRGPEKFATKANFGGGKKNRSRRFSIFCVFTQPDRRRVYRQAMRSPAFLPRKPRVGPKEILITSLKRLFRQHRSKAFKASVCLIH